MIYLRHTCPSLNCCYVAGTWDAVAAGVSDVVVVVEEGVDCVGVVAVEVVAGMVLPSLEEEAAAAATARHLDGVLRLRTYLS